MNAKPQNSPLTTSSMRTAILHSLLNPTTSFDSDLSPIDKI